MLEKPQYPQALEDFWVQRAEAVLEGRSLRVLKPHVAGLSTHFTAERPDHFSNYVRTPWSLLAYGLYFFPQSWVRLQYPLKELLELRGWNPKVPEGGAFNVLDLGAGLGGSGLSALACLYEHGRGPVHLHALDHSPHALAALKEAHSAHYGTLWPKSRLYTYRESILRFEEFQTPLTKQKFQLIILSFSLNETHLKASFEEKLSFLKKCLRCLAKEGLLLILEPALKETSKNLHALSEALITQKAAFSWGPYFHQGGCPLLKSKEVWSHEVRTWIPPRSVQQVGQDVVENLHELKFSFSVLGQIPPPPVSELGHTLRLIAPPYATKSVFLLKGVAQDGHVHTYELQKREATPEDVHRIKTLHRGDILHLPNFLDLPSPRCHRLSPGGVPPAAGA